MSGWYRIGVERGASIFSWKRRIYEEIHLFLGAGESCSLVIGLHRFTGMSYIYIDDVRVAIALRALPSPPPRPSPVFSITYDEVLTGGVAAPEFPDVVTIRFPM